MRNGDESPTRYRHHHHHKKSSSRKKDDTDSNEEKQFDLRNRLNELKKSKDRDVSERVSSADREHHSHHRTKQIHDYEPYHKSSLSSTVVATSSHRSGSSSSHNAYSTEYRHHSSSRSSATESSKKSSAEKYIHQHHHHHQHARHEPTHDSSIKTKKSKIIDDAEVNEIISEEEEVSLLLPSHESSHSSNENDKPAETNQESNEANNNSGSDQENDQKSVCSDKSEAQSEQKSSEEDEIDDEDLETREARLKAKLREKFLKEELRKKYQENKIKSKKATKKSKKRSASSSRSSSVKSGRSTASKKEETDKSIDQDNSTDDTERYDDKTSVLSDADSMHSKSVNSNQSGHSGSKKIGKKTNGHKHESRSKRKNASHDSHSSSESSSTDHSAHYESKKNSSKKTKRVYETKTSIAAEKDLVEIETVTEISQVEIAPATPSPITYFCGIQGCRSVEEFECLNKIEEGAYGVVYRAKDKKSNQVVALKRLKMEKEREGFPITTIREVGTLLKAQHPNVVTIREIVVGSNMDKIYMVMDYVEHDLKSLMQYSMKKPFLMSEVKTLMLQILRGIAHLHDNWIIHRDLKTSNLLLSHKGVIKIADFGLAREYGSPLKEYTPVVVTLWYRSPELLLNTKKYSTSIDMWSVGCIFGELMLLKALFPGKNEKDQLDKIFKDLGTPNDKIWPGFKDLPLTKMLNFPDYPYNTLRSRFKSFLSDKGFELINKLLTYDPDRRISADDSLKHDFFKESPLPIDSTIFPTWPAKSEGVSKAKKPQDSEPRAPSAGKTYDQLLQEDDGFILQFPAVSGGFTLK